jgi:hypothetical protein
MRSRPSFALLLAHHFRMPTLNGYSGWSPRGWEIHLDGRVHRIERAPAIAAAASWARLNRLDPQQTCVYDLPRRNWQAGLQTAAAGAPLSL